MICDRTSRLDIRKLAKHGWHLPDRFEFAGGVLETTWTSTNLGGQRQWFLCPACARRCAILYGSPSEPKLGCRVCLKGRYLSEHMNPQARQLHAALKVRRRLGQKQGGIVAPFPPKPNGMHWLTWEAFRIAAAHEELDILLEGYADITSIGVEKAKKHFLKD